MTDSSPLPLVYFLEGLFVRSEMVYFQIRPSFQSACFGMALVVLAGCASDPGKLSAAERSEAQERAVLQEKFVNRVTWGASPSLAVSVASEGTSTFLEHQLHPARATLPVAVAQQIDALSISRTPLSALVLSLEEERKNADAIQDPEQKKTAQQALQQEMNTLGHEAQVRSILLDLYSSNQLQEQMTWFWMNHFNVHMYKSNIRVLVGDYEEHAIREHALGHFRDLLLATLKHPAMLRYLDNDQNAVGHLNENYAREIMELHTMGVTGGYSQRDVQELARVLTGVGVNFGPNEPKLPPKLEPLYVHQGLFEFNPARHDFGDKIVLGKQIKGRGWPEVEEVVTLLSREPATARYISQELAVYLVSDDPPPALVLRMAQTFSKTDGDIAQVLRTLFDSPEFTASLGAKFKDPLHYVVSAVRLAYDTKAIRNANPIVNWVSRMNEPLFAHETPDGYSMVETAWAGSGQMASRFEVAKAIGANSAGLFKIDGPPAVEDPGFPLLSNALYYAAIEKTLHASTRQALEQANSPQEWNAFFLSSPEFMNR
ncbi:MAG: DUF1800 domain-containing protein [Burkholderiaceae bacterium]